MFKHLNETLEAYQRRDPAARSKLEIFLLYQGVHAVSPSGSLVILPSL